MMRLSRLVFCAVVLAAAILAAPAFAQCRDTGIDPVAVEKLVNAADMAALDSAYARITAKDVAVTAVYRKRRLALNPTDAEGARFVRGLPKTQADLKRIQLLTQTRDVCDLPEVSETVYGMFNTAAQVIQKLGKSHKALIEAASLADAELKDSAWPAVDYLLENDTKRTLAALRAMPEKSRVGICHGQDPMKLKEQQALEQCRSGL